jgi:hypothetical protein
MNCGRALCSLNNIAEASGQHVDSGWYRALIEYDKDIDPQRWTQLSTVIQILKRWARAVDEPGDLMSTDEWAFHTFASLDTDHRITLGQKGLEHFLDTLHVDKIVGLDESTFTDYLCCINSFLGPMDPRIMVEVDKRSV